MGIKAIPGLPARLCTGEKQSATAMMNVGAENQADDYSPSI
jgi:hypothetical protein